MTSDNSPSREELLKEVQALRSRIADLEREQNILQSGTSPSDTVNQTLLAKERFKLAAKAVNGLIYDFDLQTNTIFRSGGLFDIVGFHPYEVPQTLEWWTDHIHEEDRERCIQLVDSLLSDPNQDHFEIEYRVRHKDGRYRHLWDRACIIRNQQGRATRIVGFNSDVTDRKLAQEALEKSERRLRSVVNSSMIGVIFWNDNGAITDANEAFLSLVGYTQEDLWAGRLRWDSLTPPEYRHLDETALAQLKTFGRCSPFKKEYIHKKETGSPFSSD